VQVRNTTRAGRLKRIDPEEYGRVLASHLTETLREDANEDNRFGDVRYLGSRVEEWADRKEGAPSDG
jgi:hypothetical protein